MDRYDHISEIISEMDKRQRLKSKRLRRIRTFNQSVYSAPIFPPSFEEIDHLFEGITTVNTSEDRGAALDILESVIGDSIALR